jgi:hypothetical protein
MRSILKMHGKVYGFYISVLSFFSFHVLVSKCWGKRKKVVENKRIKKEVGLANSNHKKDISSCQYIYL